MCCFDVSVSFQFTDEITDEIVWLIAGYFNICLPVISSSVSSVAPTDQSQLAADAGDESSSADGLTTTTHLQESTHRSRFDFIPWYDWIVRGMLLVLIVVIVVVLLFILIRRNRRVSEYGGWCRNSLFAA